MILGVTYTINRLDLKKLLLVRGISEGSIEEIIAQFNKAHRHESAVAFVDTLQKLGLDSTEISNVLRRIGVDDVSIASVFDSLDEEKIKNSYGRLVELQIQ